MKIRIIEIFGTKHVSVISENKIISLCGEDLDNYEKITEETLIRYIEAIQFAVLTIISKDLYNEKVLGIKLKYNLEEKINFLIKDFLDTYDMEEETKELFLLRVKEKINFNGE